MQSLCEECAHVREIVSQRGSRFLMCMLAQQDARLTKYPPQPVVRCPGHEPRPQLALEIRPGSFSVCRLDPGEPTPEWAVGALVSITRTATELSVVCAEDAVPAHIQSQPGWRCLSVAGVLPFSMVGVIQGLTAPLAAAGISVFVVSSFDTDHLLVPGVDLERAVGHLEAAGYRVTGEPGG